jgi:EmrB/QacA subfamily drug resistance transporter
MAGLIMALALAALDQNIVSTALPRIVSELGGLSQLSWTVTAFMLTSTATTPLYGKLSDMYGRKPLFVISIGVFIVGSMLCGAAHSMTQLIFFRGLQGIGAGGLMTLTQTTVGDMLEPRERGRYQGLFSATFAVCSVVGPIVGGILTSALSWRWVFYVNLPVGGVALTLISIGLRRSSRIVRHRIDYPGAALLVAATTSVLLLLSWGGVVYPWASAVILGLGATSAILIVILVIQELNAAEPILPMRLFRNATFSIGVVVCSLLMMSAFASGVFLPLYFQLVLGANPATAGLMMSPQIGGMIVASVIGGHLLSRTGRYKWFLIAGLTLVLLGFLALAAIIPLELGILSIELGLFGLGLGMGLSMPTLTIVIQNAASRADLGVATSSMSFLRSLGGSFGVAMAGSIMTSRLHALLPSDANIAGGRSLLDVGVQQLAQVPAPLHALLLTAYRHAISTTFIASAIVASIGLACAAILRERRLD